MMARVDSLFYLDNWLLVGMSPVEAKWMVGKTLEITQGIGFQFNLPKSNLSLMQSLMWLGFIWDTKKQSLMVSNDNRNRILQKLHLMTSALTMIRCQWESLIRSLNFAVDVVTLVRLRMQCLLLGGQQGVPSPALRHSSTHPKPDPCPPESLVRQGLPYDRGTVDSPHPLHLCRLQCLTHRVGIPIIDGSPTCWDMADVPTEMTHQCQGTVDTMAVPTNNYHLTGCGNCLLPMQPGGSQMSQQARLDEIPPPLFDLREDFQQDSPARKTSLRHLCSGKMERLSGCAIEAKGINHQMGAEGGSLPPYMQPLG